MAWLVWGWSYRQRTSLDEPHPLLQPPSHVAAFPLHPWHTESHVCEGRHLNSLGIMTLKKKSYAAPGNENYKYSNLRKG